MKKALTTSITGQDDPLFRRVTSRKKIQSLRDQTPSLFVKQSESGSPLSGTLPLTLIEVQTVSHFGEDAIIRYDNVCARGQGAKG